MLELWLDCAVALAHTLLAGVGRDVSTSNRRGSDAVNEPDLVATMARELTQAKVLLQQYMQENEDLRIENVALSNHYQAFQLDQERLERENRTLMRQLKQAKMEFERAHVPGSNYASRSVSKTVRVVYHAQYLVDGPLLAEQTQTTHQIGQPRGRVVL
jgi:regulator of replication initiation timing